MYKVYFKQGLGLHLKKKYEYVFSRITKSLKEGAN